MRLSSVIIPDAGHRSSPDPIRGDRGIGKAGGILASDTGQIEIGQGVGPFEYSLAENSQGCYRYDSGLTIAISAEMSSQTMFS